MSTSNQLREKYARLKGQRTVLAEELVVLEAIEKRIRWATREIERLDQTLEAVAQTTVLFDPAFDPENVVPIAPRSKTFPIGHNGYIRAALRVLRLAEHPLTASQIADAVHELLRLPDRTAWKVIRASIQGSLQRYVDKGIVRVHPVKPLEYSIQRLPG